MKTDKLIINVALTGSVPTKHENPNVPISPAEIAAGAKEAHSLGASIVHIHARDKNGDPTHSKTVFGETIERIRDKCEDLIITVSTSGRVTREVGKRMEVLELQGDLKPDMASLTLGSMNFIDGFNQNSPETIMSILESMKSANITPEIEIFDTGMANYAKYLFAKGYLKGTHYGNLILGSLGTMPATPGNLVHLLGELPDEIVWGATGVGRFTFDVQCLAMALGGHLRVGLEDSVYMDKEKREPATNAKLIERVKKVAHAMGREIATPKEVRGLLGL